MSRTETATGVRQTLEKKVITLPVTRCTKTTDLQHKVGLPPQFLRHEPTRTRERISHLWNTRVLATMAELIRTRKTSWMNKHMRRTVFKSGMENLIADFNRGTENIKVEFREHQDHNKQKPTSYSLEFVRLSPIAESVRNAPIFTAGIIHVEEEEHVAQAQLIERSPSSTDQLDEQSDPSPSRCDGGTSISLSNEGFVGEIFADSPIIIIQSTDLQRNQANFPNAIRETECDLYDGIPMADIVAVEDVNNNNATTILNAHHERRQSDEVPLTNVWFQSNVLETGATAQTAEEVSSTTPLVDCWIVT